MVLAKIQLGNVYFLIKSLQFHWLFSTSLWESIVRNFKNGHHPMSAAWVPTTAPNCPVPGFHIGHKCLKVTVARISVKRWSVDMISFTQWPVDTISFTWSWEARKPHLCNFYAAANFLKLNAVILVSKLDAIAYNDPELFMWHINGITREQRNQDWKIQKRICVNRSRNKVGVMGTWFSWPRLSHRESSWG